MAVFHVISCLFSLIFATGFCQLQTIYQFPNETWVENLAIRDNGNILVTLIGRPEVWEINPCVTPATASLLYTFPQANSALGIAEYAPDSFAINVGNFSAAAGGGTKGSWSIWSLNVTSGTVARKISNLPHAVLLNGMAALPDNPTTILTADSTTGEIHSVETQTGATTVVIAGSFLQPNTSADLPIGVNGIQFRPGTPNALYFDNTFKPPTFASIAINPSTGQQQGQPAVVINKPTWPTNGGFSSDDFTFDSQGQFAWLGTTPSNELVRIDLSTKQAEVVVGSTDSTQLVGPTSCKFGRSSEDVWRGRLYITTNGGLANPPPSGVTGGKVVAFDTNQQGWE